MTEATMTQIDTFTDDLHPGWEAILFADDHPTSPRDNDNLCQLWLAHRRYSLAREIDLGVRGRAEDHFSSWAEVKAAVEEAIGSPALILPVYMIDHGQVALSTRDFRDPWDSGQVGFAALSHAKIMEEYAWGDGDKTPKPTQDIIDQARRCIEAEVREYGQYLNGECFGYVVKDPQGEERDACWGFVGFDDAESAARVALRACAAFHSGQLPELAEAFQHLSGE